MSKTQPSLWEELASPAQRDQLEQRAHEQRWPLALMLTGWLHLLAFSLCYYLTIVESYHEPAAYTGIWLTEVLGMALAFLLCRRRGPQEVKSVPLARFVVRLWLAYLLLAFNLATLNTLRGHQMFELFPAMGTLASFAFLAMTFVVSRRFFAAVLVMFASGLLMAATLLHAYLIFAVAWWLVLNGIGLTLQARARASSPKRSVPRTETAALDRKTLAREDSGARSS